MRLYHSILFLLGLALLLGTCDIAPAADAVVQAHIFVDGQALDVQAPGSGTVQDALESAEITLGVLDRIEPELHIPLSEGIEITVTRIYEEFEVEQVVIPFEEQMQPSEFLPEGERQRLQLGENGIKEITYRIVYEDGVEISKAEIKSSILKEAVPQIMLVGVQTSFSPRAIPGRLLYLSDGNAWMMEGTTANRSAIVSSGDLDGRVFRLSDDGEWLLFTRHANAEEDMINTLWVLSIKNPEIEIDLDVANVIHFADWQPGSLAWAVVSTVEPRQAAPGWQANNDLQLINFSESGWVDPSPTVLLETNSGGVYGWWGTSFAYGPVAGSVAYATPDQVGLVDLDAGAFSPIMDIVPLKTLGDWAWVPGLVWGPDGELLFIVRHAPPPGSASPEEAQNFNLTVIPVASGRALDLISQVGMFAYPRTSPILAQANGEKAYQVAYLQAIFPEQSDTSRYRLMVMDRDGSNRRELFPPAEAQGIDPQRDWGVWSPQIVEGSQGHALAVLYQGNIWLVDSITGEAWQITGDGRINRVDWR